MDRLVLVCFLFYCRVSHRFVQRTLGTGRGTTGRWSGSTRRIRTATRGFGPGNVHNILSTAFVCASVPPNERARL